jgi:hypothetical protein
MVASSGSFALAMYSCLIWWTDTRHTDPPAVRDGSVGTALHGVNPAAHLLTALTLTYELVEVAFACVLAKVLAQPRAIGSVPSEAYPEARLRGTPLEAPVR